MMDTSWNSLACAHIHQETRKRTLSNGSVAYWDQCMKCGRGIRARKKSEVIGTPEDWDEELHRREQDRLSAQYQRLHDEKNREFWDTYNAHIRSDKWRELRRKVIKRCGGICEGCAVNDVDHIHHTTYTHLGNELLFELLGLCHDCHERTHGHAIGDDYPIEGKQSAG